MMKFKLPEQKQVTLSSLSEVIEENNLEILNAKFPAQKKSFFNQSATSNECIMLNEIALMRISKY